MQNLKDEILEIRARAELCFEKNRSLKLPPHVPYLGMGSSYNAALVASYCGASIQPFLASEYYWYLAKKKEPLGVLISQSGETSEILWSTQKFEKVVAITNNPDSALAKAQNTAQTIELHAGEEGFSATKTYINTLLCLYLGLGMDPSKAIGKLEDSLSSYASLAQQEAEAISRYMQARSTKGLFVLGSGPNWGTAKQGALLLSETTTFAWQGMSVEEYDHGYKETAENSIVIFLMGNYKNSKRADSVRNILKQKSNANILECREEQLPETLSPFLHILHLDLLAQALQEHLHIDGNWKIGEKITRAEKSA